MADVVLVHPRHGGLQEWMRPGRGLPLGALTACTLASRAYDIRVIDQRLHRDWRARLVRELASNPLCVALGVMLGKQIVHAAEVSRVVRRHSRVPVVWGGVHVSLLPEQSLASGLMDIVVRGEGELTFLELLRALERGRRTRAPGDLPVSLLREVPGIAFKDRGKIHVTPPRPFVDLNALPPPPYHLVDVTAYNSSLSEPPEPGTLKLQMETSRGCVQGCSFCYNPVYSRRRWRALTAVRAVERMEFLVDRYGAQTLDLVDDAFFTNPARARDIARGLVDRDLRLRWFVQGARIETLLRLSEEDLELLARSGLRVVRLGAESGSLRILEAMSKPTTPRDVLAVNRKLARHGIAPWFYFTCGMPGESEEDLKRTVALLFQVLEDNPQARVVAAFCVVPMAGTEVYDQAREVDPSGVPDTLEDWAKVETHVFAPWLDAAARRRLEKIFLSSMFIDRKVEHFTDSRLVRNLVRLYRPLARARLSRLRFGPMPELWVARKLVG